MPKTSCEPGHHSAYREDLRWRIVWQREVLGYKYGQIASNLNVMCLPFGELLGYRTH